MPYKIIAPEVTIPKKVGEMSDQHGNKLDEHVSVTYYEGDVLSDDDVAPTVQRAYDAGEAHILTLIEKVSEEPTVATPTIVWADAYPVGEVPLTPAEEVEKKVAEEASTSKTTEKPLAEELALAPASTTVTAPAPSTATTTTTTKAEKP
jgi:hypothetical protein